MPRLMVSDVIINNFFYGILLRGIPIYAENLAVAISKAGCVAQMRTCPVMLRGLPRSVLNIFFVVYEQIIFPVLTVFSSRSIYPYNTISILSSLLGRSVLIVHDFIPNHRSDRSLAARYVRFTQSVHAFLGGDVAFVSRSTEKMARRLKLFPKSKKYYLPNSFYFFQDLAGKVKNLSGDYILLCSGRGPNKDLKGALDLALASDLFAKTRLHVLGLAGDRTIVDEWCAMRSVSSELIHVCGKLSDADVVREYKSSRWVWVHSLSEGYGRSIAEAKMCGKYVLASNIPPFREQKNKMVFLYRDGLSFETSLKEMDILCLRESAVIDPPVEHVDLQSELARLLR